MDSKTEMEILEKAAYYIGVIKADDKSNLSVVEKNRCIRNVGVLIEAAHLMTGSFYNWDEDGIYKDHSNEAVAKA